MSELQVIARHTIAPGNEDAVFALLPKLINAARLEPGNVAFDVYRSLDDQSSYVLLERYVSQEAFAAHRDTTHFKEIMVDQILPLLKARVIEEYEQVEGIAGR